MNAKEILESLKEDLTFYNDFIKEVSEDIISNGYSKNPIFIAHQADIIIGEVILDRNDYGKNWTISASILEEFVENNIILEENKQRFLEVYKDPQKYICIFLISEKGGNFIFHPYKNKNNSK
jgi:hypothetical protein